MNPPRNSRGARHPLTLAWWSALVLLAFLLPFELNTPWLSLGSALALTNVELVLLAAMALWGARQLWLKPPLLLKTPVTLPLAGLLGVFIIASLLAPSDNLHALKVTGRWIEGAALCLMVYNAVRGGLEMRRLIGAVALSGILVAVLAVGEARGAAGLQELLNLFRQEPQFSVGGEIRVASTLGYPTIAAVYLEITLCLLAGWLAYVWSLHRRWQGVLFAGAVWLVAEAIVLTLTRSALLAVLGGLAVTVLVRWHVAGMDRFGWAALWAGTGVAILLAGATLFNPLAQLRLLTETDRTWYQASYEVPPLPTVQAGETVSATVRVQNSGRQPWQATGVNSVHLAYHWLSADGQLIYIMEGLRTNLPYDLAPGATVELAAQVAAPSEPGDYRLAWDMVREELFWFSVLGSPPYTEPVRVEQGRSGQSGPPAATSQNALADLNLDRSVLWGAVPLMVRAHPLLGVGPGNFRLVLGQYLKLKAWDVRLHANNMYLEVLADTGLVGGLAFLVFLAALIQMIWRGFKRYAVDLASSCWPAALGAAVAAFLIHGVTDYFLEFTPVYMLFWMVVALIAVGSSSL